MNNDKKTECLRYDAHARSLLAAGNNAFGTEPALGSLAILPIYRAPYSYYEQCIRRYISKEDDVLELCSGTGLHTYTLTQTGARVVASDISSHSLGVLVQHIARRMSRRFWGRKMQFIAFVRAKNRAERSPKGVGSIGLVRRSALRGAVQVQSSIRRALGRSAKRSALTRG